MVADSLWWSVWWPWLALWVATVLALLFAILAVVIGWRGHRSRAVAPPFLSFYLHPQSVMDLYQFRYRGALEQEVQARVGGRGQVRVGTDVPLVRFGASLERNREEFRRYLDIAEPITVIGILMDVLENDLIHVDLERGSLVPGRNVDIGRRKVRLSELGGRTYILARGVFNQRSADATTITFLAPYRAGAAGTPMIRVRCTTGGLRSEVPEDGFYARCLGTVQGWDAANGHLIMDPIAIFK